MKRILALVALASMSAAIALPVAGEEAAVEVKEIIIKIETADGTRWYSLGTDLSKIDIQKGAVVRFNYADDTVESFEVEEVTPDDPPAKSQ